LYDPHEEAIRHLKRGQEMLQRYQIADSVGAFEDALRQQSDFAEPHFWLGHALQELDKSDRAIDEYRQALRFGFRDPATAHNNLGTALSETGRWNEAVEQYRAALKAQPDFALVRTNLADAERRAVLSRKLDAFVADKKQPTAAERGPLAEVAHIRGLYPTATRLWFDAGTKGYHAAGSAARAGTGQGVDAKDVTEADRQRWRRASLDWMREELASLGKQLDAGKVEAVREELRHWRRNPDFDKVRAPRGLIELPPEERKGWSSLWTDTGRLLRRADSLPSGKWKIEDSELIQEQKSDSATLYVGDANWTDVTVEVEVRATGEFGLCLRAADPGTQVVVALAGQNRSTPAVLAQKDGAPLMLLGQSERVIDTADRWVKMKAVVRGDSFRVSLDDRDVFTFQVEGFPRGKVGLRTMGGTARFRNLSITLPGESKRLTLRDVMP
jgi:tetratricopeptide (TPR) repeat protein